MRTPQRNWMINDDGSWNNSAISADTMINGRESVRDLLNQNDDLRSFVIDLEESWRSKWESLAFESKNNFESSRKLFWNSLK